MDLFPNEIVETILTGGLFILYPYSQKLGVSQTLFEMP